MDETRDLSVERVTSQSDLEVLSCRGVVKYFIPAGSRTAVKYDAEIVFVFIELRLCLMRKLNMAEHSQL